MKISIFVVFSVLLSTVVGQPTTLSYQKGEEWTFDFQTNVDSNGYVMQDNSRTPGAFTIIAGTLAIQCTDIDSSNYYFAFNIFDSTFVVGQGTAQNYSYQVPGPIGDDMYFQQTYTGQIVQIWYENDDDPILVNLRIGLINAFHTHLIGYTATTLQESDPVAVHNSRVTGSSKPSVALSIAKEFTQIDVITFSDPSVKQNNVQFTGKTVTDVNGDGKIIGATIAHVCNMVDMSSESSATKATAESDNDIPINSVMSSLGSLSIDNGKPSSKNMLSPAQNKGSLAQSENHTKSTFFEAASKFIENKKNVIASEEELVRAAKAFVFQTESLKLGQQFQIFDHMNRASQKDEKLIKRVLSPVIHKFKMLKNQAKDINSAQARFFQLLASMNSKYTESLLVEALESNHAQTRINALFALRLATATDKLMTSVYAIAENEEEDSYIRNIAFLHAGILVKKSGCPGRQSHLMKLVSKHFDSDSKLARKILQNAGVVSEISVPKSSPMPYNKSYTQDYSFGGKVVGLNISAELFAGTNFDCNEPTFNYEALADAQATLSVLGKAQSLFHAEACYGKINGVAQDDELLLTVWNDVIYHQSIPQVDCQEHTYPLEHSAPGFSVSYLVWVVIVPITFNAGASVDIKMSWGWQICDTDLSAMVEFVPTATPTLYGKAEIDLYVVKAGVELNGGFGMSIVPQGYIHGSECTIGFDIRQENPGMEIDLDSYYQTVHCKWIIFDCHYRPQNTQQWFSWSYAAQNKVLYQQNWKIAP